MYRRWIGLLVGVLLGGNAAAQELPATAKDIAQVLASGPTYRSYPQGNVVAWERDLRAGLAHGSAQHAADAIAAKYGFTQAEMRGLVNAWIIGQARHFALPGEDRGWMPRVRADLIALLPSVRRQPLGMVIAAETLDTIDDCSGGAPGTLMGNDMSPCSAVNFDALIKGSADPAADAYVIANAAPSSNAFARAALAAPDRSMPALIRIANWGSLPPRDTLPLYAWLTSPVALARISPADRPALSAILWQRYFEALLKIGLTTRALELLDGMPADLRGRVLAPRDQAVGTAMVDGIAMSFQREGGSAITISTITETGESLEVAGKSTAPILQVALAMAVVNRNAEARTLLETLPGLAAARAAAQCRYQQVDTGSKHCPDTHDFPTMALALDHLLNHDGEDPYPIAETILVNPYGDWTPADVEIQCRVFLADQFPGVCADARKAVLAGVQLDQGGNAGEVAAGEAALARIVPGFAVLRDGFVAEAAAVQGRAMGGSTTTAAARWTRDTVAPVTPGFAEHPLPVADPGMDTSPAPLGLAKLPGGFKLMRAERAGQRAIAISVSQTYDPTGEVSRGGYWVHLSDDGGAHWQKPLYTGLADRFPYVVAEHSRLPLLSSDTLNLAVDIAEIDTASITYPPVGLRTSRRKTGLYLEIPLVDLRRDSDGDGLTDLAAHHLLVDQARTDGGTPFVVGSDRGAACAAAPSPDRQARIALIGKLFDPATAAIVEPTDRPAGKIMTGWQRATAAADRPLFLLGDPKDYACLHPGRPMIVYGKEDIAAIERFTPDFHPVELPPIIFNRARDRGYVRWSTGWAGGTYRLRLIKGKWVFDTLSSWIS